MADGDLATKAPESDAAVHQVTHQVIPGEASVQSGSGLGEHCVGDRPTPVGPAPSGEVTKIADVDVYVSKPSDYPHQPSKLLLLLTGGTGMQSRNNQLQADKFASKGFLVVMPDMFDGDYAPNSSMTVEETDLTMIEQIKLGIADVVKSFNLDMWIARQTSEKVLPTLYKVLEGAREEFADAVASGGGIYGVGYCLGGRFLLQLASENPAALLGVQKVVDEEAGLVQNGPCIKTGAIAHGALVTKEDFEGLKSPILLVCVENDQLFSQDILREGEQYMEEHNIEHEIKIFPGVPHGFAVVGQYDDPKIRAAQELAFDQMLSWLKTH